MTRVCRFICSLRLLSCFYKNSPSGVRLKGGGAQRLTKKALEVGLPQLLAAAPAGNAVCASADVDFGVCEVTRHAIAAAHDLRAVHALLHVAKRVVSKLRPSEKYTVWRQTFYCIAVYWHCVP